MFRKTIAVLLVFSIALSSCGKKDNDFVRTAPVESQESQESSESPEIRDPSEPREPVKSLTLFKSLEARASATCDRFDSCRFVRDHWQYEMINVFDVAITPKRVFWTVTAVGSAYAVYKMPIFRWIRNSRACRAYSMGEGSLFFNECTYDDSISDWLRWRFGFRIRCTRLFSTASPSSIEEPVIDGVFYSHSEHSYHRGSNPPADSFPSFKIDFLPNK